MRTVEERVDRLEALMGQFIVQVNTALLRLEKGMEEFKDENRKETRKINKQWGDIAKKMGTIVEDLIAPALRPVLSKYFECDSKMEGQRIRKRIKGEEYEVDVIALCNDKVFMIEVKSAPKAEYVDEIGDKAKRFFEFFPEYKDKELIIIFGGISFTDNVIQYATKKRVYVMAYREWEYMDILNFDEVKKHFKKTR